jgi:hypothetical protein
MAMTSDGVPVRPDHELTAFQRPLPSGRTLVVRVGAESEELEVRDRRGALELTISLTETGPMVWIRAARIALESSETISLQCRRFEVETTEAIHFESGGEVRIGAREMRVRAEEDVHLDGAMIRLNCDTQSELSRDEVAAPSGPKV